MTENEVKLVQDSFELAAPHAAELSANFYSILFEMAPEVRELFPEDLREQQGKLMHMIAFIVRRLHVIDEIVKPVENLGVRHVHYGAKPEHYPVVGAALLKALNTTFPDAFTPEMESAWAKAYGILTTVMLGAAEREAVPA